MHIIKLKRHQICKLQYMDWRLVTIMTAIRHLNFEVEVVLTIFHDIWEIEDNFHFDFKHAHDCHNINSYYIKEK